MPNSKASLIWATPNIEHIIAYCARVSNPANQNNTATATKLLKYCMDNRHWSVFEMGNICIEISCTRDIARQILRHRSFSFQEFCLSGDTDIYFSVPTKLRQGKYKPTYKTKLKKLWGQWNTPQMRERVKKRYIKCFDEQTGKLTTTHIKEVFSTGVKPIFEITLSDGKKIKTTKEHKFLTKEGFATLENIVGLTMKNDRALMSVNQPIIGVNGVAAYTDKEWLQQKKKESLFVGGGLPWLVETTGFNYNTLRKWLKKHEISYSKQESAQTFDVWNKGKTGYTLRPWTPEERKKQSERAKSRGVNHNWYRGGNSHKREALNETDSRLFREQNHFTCQRCSQVGGVLDIHHKMPVSERPDLIHDVTNWELLCRSCHKEHHRKQDMTGWQKMGGEAKIKNSYIPKWVTIDKIQYVGEEETYDIEVEHSSHNYVANGIIAHNSQRYALVEDEWESSEARMQDHKNRQNSIPTADREIQRWWWEQQAAVQKKAKDVYNTAINMGIAKEVARKVMPEGLTMSRMYVNGTVRSWLHYIDVRCDKATQKEHRDVAEQCKDIVFGLLPSLDTRLPDGSYHGTNVC